MSAPVLTLWIVTIVLKYVLLAVLILLNHHLSWPTFTKYIFFSAFKSLILLAVRNHQVWYFWCYYVGVILDSVLMFLVASELCTKVFAPWFYQPKDIARKMTSYLTFGLALCIVTSVAHIPATLSPYLAAGRLVDRLSATIFFGIFAIMAYGSKQLGIPWRRYAFGIGAGFIVSLSLDAATGAILAPMLRPQCEEFRLFSMAGFPLALSIWIYYFLRSEPGCIPVETTFLVSLRTQLLKSIHSLKVSRVKERITQGNGAYSVVIPEPTSREYIFGQRKSEQP